MFKGRWELVRQLLANKKHQQKIKFYMNENGRNECCLNMVCINMTEHRPYSGDLALLIPVSIFNNKISLKMFKPVKLPNGDDDERMGMFEADDEEDIEKMMKWCEEKGYEYNQSTGQVFEKGIPKEEEPEGPSVIRLSIQEQPVGPNEEKKD
jgi:hypothetical protein